MSFQFGFKMDIDTLKVRSFKKTQKQRENHIDWLLEKAHDIDSDYFIRRVTAITRDYWM